MGLVGTLFPGADQRSGGHGRHTAVEVGRGEEDRLKVGPVREEPKGETKGQGLLSVDWPEASALGS